MKMAESIVISGIDGYWGEYLYIFNGMDKSGESGLNRGDYRSGYRSISVLKMAVEVWVERIGAICKIVMVFIM
jgi:hypothetical protein